MNPRSTAIEMTAAGIEVANVRPALSPKKTLAAVNTSVITTPRITPRTVNSVRGSATVFAELITRISLLVEMGGWQACFVIVAIGDEHTPTAQVSQTLHFSCTS